MGTFISVFSDMRKCRINFLLSHLRKIRNLEYIREFVVFVTVFLRNYYLSEGFKFHDTIIN
jgi:hypothetical protein